MSNSEHLDVDMDDSIPLAKGRTTKAPQQVLKKVVVPMNSRSSLGSSLSGVRDQSSEYDTPATSVAVTPAEFLVKDETANRNFGKLSRSNMLDAMTENPTKGKRKRSEKDELIESGTLLAQALQKEEYKMEEPCWSTSKRGRKGRIKDSEDDDPLSSSMAETSTTPAMFRTQGSRPCGQSTFGFRASLEEGSEEEIGDSFIADSPGLKKVKTAQRASLPSRAARDSAKISMKDSCSHQILDSEDSELSGDLSEVSLFASDSESDAFAESGDSDAEVYDALEGSNDATTTASAVATASSNAITAQTTVPRRRRARATRAANPNRVRHRYGGMEDRVGYRYLRLKYTVETDGS